MSHDTTQLPETVDDPDTYERVAAVDDVPEMRPLRVEINGHGILLCLKAGDIYAFDEICPHKQLSMRHGFVHGDALVCPHHQYKFKLDTGRCLRHRCEPAETFDILVEDGEIFVKKQGKLARG